MSTFDYVIVGAGSAGCVLANRLTEDRRSTVLLVEAGGRDASPFIHIPAGMLQIRSKHGWDYVGEPDPSCPGLDPRWLAGRVLGGGSSINGQVWTRGDPADFDRWAESGCEGWDYRSVLPYFKRIETYAGGGDPYRGDRGPMRIGPLAVSHPLSQAFVCGAEQVGIPFNPDLNGASQAGVSYAQVSQRRGWRHSTARAYLAPARRRRNLTIAPNAFATRVLLSGDRASGVEYRSSRGRVVEVAARREVIVSAGAIGSPKLLQLSGIGSASELRSVGIETVYDNPAVGTNLQEHPGLFVGCRVSVPTLNLEVTVRGAIKHGFDFVIRGRGPATTPPTHVFVFAGGSHASSRDAYELMFSPFGMEARQSSNGNRFYGSIKPTTEPTIQICVASSHPQARGSVTLRSADPDDPPVVRHRLLTDHDIAVLTAGARRAREILASPAFAPFVVSELFPGPDVETDDDWSTYVRAAAGKASHPIGTCKMGVDEEAVVLPDLTVIGVDGLRVVDASVMPTLISGHTNAATIMIAERAADLVRNT